MKRISLNLYGKITLLFIFLIPLNLFSTNKSELIKLKNNKGELIKIEKENTKNKSQTIEEKEEKIFKGTFNSSDFNDPVEARKFRERLRSVLRQMNEIKPGVYGTQKTIKNQKSATSTKPDYNSPFGKDSNSIKAVMNPVIKLFVQYYTTVGKKYLENAFKQMEKYYPVIKQMLKQNALPIELVALPVIESGYIEYARSSSGALGLWQLMPMTAKMSGCEINAYTDERLDILKATKAAIKFIQHLKETFVNWDLVLAAYNGGGNYLLQQMRKYRTDNFWEFSRKEGFSQQTMEYVPRFYAVLHILQNLKKYGFKPIDFNKNIYFETVNIQGTHKITTIAKIMDLQAFELKELNPQLLQNITPPKKKSYELKIPVNFKKVYLVKKHLLQKTVAPRYAYKFVHKKILVRHGDTLNEIARRYKVNVKTLAQINHLRNPNVLTVGMPLLLPVKIKVYSNKPVKANKPANRQKRIHKQKQKQKRHYRRTRTRRSYAYKKQKQRRIALQRKKQKRTRYLKRRRRLLLMIQARRRARTNRKNIKYRIKRGDTVIKISRKLKISKRRIIRANNGTTKLIAGRVLRIK